REHARIERDRCLAGQRTRNWTRERFRTLGCPSAYGNARTFDAVDHQSRLDEPGSAVHARERDIRSDDQLARELGCGRILKRDSRREDLQRRSVLHPIALLADVPLAEKTEGEKRSTGAP